MEEDDSLAILGKSLGLTVIRGSKEDVLSRFALATKHTDADVLVRITGDCPLVDPSLLQEMIQEFSNQDVDYLSNCIQPTYPDGLDIEIFNRHSLLCAEKHCQNATEREHVTPWIRNNRQFKLGQKKYHVDYSSIRLTVDEPEDLQVIRSIITHFKGESNFDWQEVIKLAEQQPQLFTPNSKFTRNEGSVMGEGQKLWRRAKRVIPGGNMLLSKRAEMFLQRNAHLLLSSQSCRIWNLDGQELIDMSIMGIGTNMLGYGHPEEMCSIKQCDSRQHEHKLPGGSVVGRKANTTSMAEMARFARTGGEANAIAIRCPRSNRKMQLYVAIMVGMTGIWQLISKMNRV